MSNPYAPPSAPVRVPTSDDAAPFFVVSPAKLVVLYLVTFGLYPLYWFYMHWSRARVGREETIWPVARAVFAVFFVHALARRIDGRLRAVGLPRRWWPMTLATVYVALEVLNYGSAIAWPWLVFHLPNRWLWLEWLGLLVLPFSAACLVRLQIAANAASGDPLATSNRRFTAFNLAWIALGGGATCWTLYEAFRSGSAGF
ncbi:MULTISPECIES: DUF4234 domain-containing protein [Luteimonas]|uniref:DUF4234 domain-containing protein n=1 Tax=Luteimonas TaxID=83614 RepID=UPI000C7DB957|nr:MULTISPECIES: DUF4234 domain-containing protein [Luteimonas]